MSASFNFKLKQSTRALEKMQSNFKKKYQAQVGVIGDKGKRGDKSGLTNADVLLIHEVGSFTKNIPRRSVFESLNINHKELSNNITKIVSHAIKVQDPIYNVYFKTALIMLEICKEAFFTNGYGTWPPLKQSTIDSKLQGNASAQQFTLIDTSALYNAFTFRVKKIN